jgi:hypothetical protein
MQKLWGIAPVQIKDLLARRRPADAAEERRERRARASVSGVGQ